MEFWRAGALFSQAAGGMAGDKLPSSLHLWCHDQDLVFAHGGVQSDRPAAHM